jgi:hypothetical protein
MEMGMYTRKFPSSMTARLATLIGTGLVIMGCSQGAGTQTESPSPTSGSDAANSCGLAQGAGQAGAGGAGKAGAAGGPGWRCGQAGAGGAGRLAQAVQARLAQAVQARLAQAVQARLAQAVRARLVAGQAVQARPGWAQAVPAKRAGRRVDLEPIVGLPLSVRGRLL